MGSIFFMYICIMKTLEYRGYTFYYKIEEFECGDYGIFTCYETKFYKHLGKATKKKYWLWGPEVEYDKYEDWFVLPYSIQDCGVTKEKVRRNLDREITLIERCEEIKKGIIV